MKINITCPVLRPLVEAGVPVIMTAEGYKIEGFYKSGSILLVPNCPEGQEEESWDLPRYIAHQRYDGQDSIRTFEDVLSLQAYWYDRSVGSNGPHPPHPNWEKLLIEHGYIERKEKTVVEFTRPGRQRP